MLTFVGQKQQPDLVSNIKLGQHHVMYQTVYSVALTGQDRVQHCHESRDHLSRGAAILADVVERPGEGLGQLVNHLRRQSIWVQAVLNDTGHNACLS